MCSSREGGGGQSDQPHSIVVSGMDKHVIISEGENTVYIRTNVRRHEKKRPTGFKIGLYASCKPYASQGLDIKV